MGKAAADFDKIIQEGRERKRNQDLAQNIFSKTRRQSAPSNLKPGSGPSLASRVGVKKRVASTSVPKASVGRANDKRVHNGLNATQATSGQQSKSTAARASIGGRNANPRIANNNARASNNAKRASQMAAAIERADQTPAASRQANVVRKTAKQNPQPTRSQSPALMIKGLASPAWFYVMAQNFAPGTTAADIEAAMTPVGGEMISCTILKTAPIVVVEIVFATREGGERVIEVFNDRLADGRRIQVYPKPINAPSAQNSSTTSEQRSARSIVVDGSMGFSESPVGHENITTASSTRGTNGLYSDRMVGSAGRGGRGSYRGRPR